MDPRTDCVRIPAKTVKIVAAGLFLILFLIPTVWSPLGIPLQRLHGCYGEKTPDSLWLYFSIRALAFVAIPALAVWFFRLLRRVRPRRMLPLALVFGLVCGGLRACYVPEFDPVCNTIVGSPIFVFTRHAPGFRFLPFLRIPLGATRDEVRAACGEGWAWYNPDEPHGVSKTADESGGWFFSAGVGTDDGWRFGVWFDESGRVKEKDAYYCYD